jgi:magnesium chelatase subunit D
VSPFDPAWPAFEDRPDGDAMCAASLLAVDPVGLGGILLRAWSGPARDDFLATLLQMFPAGTAAKKIPLNITEDRLLGGLDLAATLAHGKPVYQPGLLAQSRNALLLLAMAERISAGTAAKLAAAWDDGGPFCMVALDEGGADEAPPAALTDRLAFTLSDFGGRPASRTEIANARQRLQSVTTPAAALDQICTAAALLGVGSLRACLFAHRAAGASAALRGGSHVEDPDIATAIRLVLLPRATQTPQMSPAESAPEPRDADAETAPQEQPEIVEDRVEDAAPAVLPEKLLALLAQNAGPRRTARGSGKSGAGASRKRGRPVGARAGTLGGDARLSLLDTLRAAAPWQRLRQRPAGPRRMVVRPDDIRIKFFKEKARSVTIFAVDASGSSALNRLSEAKGAILLLLADCYVRRDEVALVAFRGAGAEILLWRAPAAALRDCRAVAQPRSPPASPRRVCWRRRSAARAIFRCCSCLPMAAPISRSTVRKGGSPPGPTRSPRPNSAKAFRPWCSTPHPANRISSASSQPR